MPSEASHTGSVEPSSSTTAAVPPALVQHQRRHLEGRALDLRRARAARRRRRRAPPSSVTRCDFRYRRVGGWTTWQLADPPGAVGKHPEALRDQPAACRRRHLSQRGITRHRDGRRGPMNRSDGAARWPTVALARDQPIDRRRPRPQERCQERIAAAPREDALARSRARLVILGHHYQRDEVIRHADFTGDSFKLAQLAATRPEAEFIVFCGVHFMAESADILSAPHQKVVLPDLNAGCTMADMAETDQVEDCWDARDRGRGRGRPARHLHELHRRPQGVRGPARRARSARPRTRARSSTGPSARSRACSSSPTSTSAATPATAWASRSSACRSGIPTRTAAASATTQIRDARILLWKGHCSVHNRFTPDMVDQRRAQMPGREGDRPPRVPLRGGAEGRRHRLHRGDPQDGPGEPAGHEAGPSAPSSTW